MSHGPAALAATLTFHLREDWRPAQLSVSGWWQMLALPSVSSHSPCSGHFSAPLLPGGSARHLEPRVFQGPCPPCLCPGHPALSTQRQGDPVTLCTLPPQSPGWPLPALWPVGPPLPCCFVLFPTSPQPHWACGLEQISSRAPELLALLPPPVWPAPSLRSDLTHTSFQEHGPAHPVAETTLPCPLVSFLFCSCAPEHQLQEERDFGWSTDRFPLKCGSRSS